MTDDDTIRSLRAALAVSPDNVPLRRHLAEILLARGHGAEAVAFATTLVLLVTTQTSEQTTGANPPNATDPAALSAAFEQLLSFHSTLIGISILSIWLGILLSAYGRRSG